MKESNLKKEFSQREVQRMRNLITGKSGERTHVQAGYEKSSTHKKEGDVWEEDGKTWTIKNGIKQNITKLDKLKKLTILPLCCPNCKKPMKVNEYNKKMYSIHGTCFSCVIKKEQDIKLAGKWDDYVKEVMDNNHKTYINHLDEALDAWLNESESHITEAGDVEVWSGGDKRAIYDEVKRQIDEIKNENK